MKLNEYLDEIISWLQNQLKKTGMNGYVLGVSGGIDSALVALLAKKAVGDKLFCVIMPCESDEKDAKDARDFLKENAIQYIEVDLTKTYQTMLKDIEQETEKEDFTIDKLSKSNMKVRLRMVTLYAIAQSRRALVLGTDNWDEYHVGYFTKYGDGGVDLLPIVHLTKGEVFEASRLLKVNETILARKPSAGLFDNQTDEEEMGIKYEELDAYLLGEKINDEAKQKIERLNLVSEHKRTKIPSPNPFNRE